MKLFDPHIHMTSRTTDDYRAMANAGITEADLVDPEVPYGHGLDADPAAVGSRRATDHYFHLKGVPMQPGALVALWYMGKTARILVCSSPGASSLSPSQAKR